MLEAQVVPKLTRSADLRCRVCRSTQLLRYLNLGKQPYANALHAPDADFPPTAPLHVFACQKCHLSQLGHVALPESLYETYAYRSGISAGWRAHCDTLAHEYGAPNKLTLDIASNDGTLVRAFRATGANAMGVEPSRSFDDCDYSRVTRYWSSGLVRELSLTGAVNVLTAQNVLGHVHDVHDFMAGIALALAPGGVAIIEVPYVCDMLRSLAFDTVYHEHLSYWSVTALRELVNAHGLTLSDIQPLKLHGGSIRAVLTRGTDVKPSVMNYLGREARDLRKSAYLRFSERVSKRILDLNDTLSQMVPYIGFGAAAKTTVLLHCLDVRAYPAIVHDDNQHKHGFAIPGTRVAIIKGDEQYNAGWRYEQRPVAIFAWNHADEIIRRLRGWGYRGAIYIPGAEPRWDMVGE